MKLKKEMKKSVIFIPLTFLIVCLMSSISTEAANLVRNPGFEDSAVTPQHWVITGPIATMEPVTSVDRLTHFGVSLDLEWRALIRIVTEGQFRQLKLPAGRHTFSPAGSGQRMSGRLINLY